VRNSEPRTVAIRICGKPHSFDFEVSVALPACCGSSTRSQALHRQLRGDVMVIYINGLS
jgi:hypothetical protein